MKIKNRNYKLFTKPKKVAFLGPDGAGKSTILENTITESAGGFGKIKYIHLKFSIARDLRQKPQIKVVKPHSNPPYGYTKSCIKYCYLIAQYLLGLIYLNLRYCKKDLIVFDRYYYDVLVDPKRFRLQEIKFLAILLKIIIPQPNVVLLITCLDPDLIYNRKQDLTLSEINRQLISYAKFKGSSILNIINQDKSVDQITKEVQEKLIDHL